MSQRQSFRATSWEMLEGRELLTSVVFPNLGLYLAQLDQKYSSTGGGGQQPQIIVIPSSIPNGYIDGRVKLTRALVNELDAAGDAFAASYTSGANPAKDSAAVATFKASLASIDNTISVTQGLPRGTTANFINPLFTSTPLSKLEVLTLENALDTFQEKATYNADSTLSNNTALYNLEASLNLEIATHPK